MELELRTHVAKSRLMADEPRAVTWIRATLQGFNESAPTDEGVQRWLDELVDTDMRMRQIHDHDTGGVRDADVPVATLSSWDTTVNIGGTLLAANAISDVTTRASHRRRGLLRQIMTADLAEAAGRGLPLAALTVSESGIYRRFGFGPAVPSAQVSVRTDATFGVTASPAGRIEMVDRDVYLSHSRPLFDEFHRRTSGSVDRTPATSDALTGADLTTGKPDPACRHALHLDDDGRCDGAVTWKTVDDHKAEVHDFVAPDPAVGIALWDFLGHLDLITTITQRRARVDDPLRYALVEPDVYTVENRRDFLWLRVLDVPAVLGARDYVVDGELTLAITDDMGFADGTYRVTVSGGKGVAERVDGGSADVTMDVAALGSVLIGGVSVATVAAAGHIRGTRIDDFARIMLTTAAPASITPF